MKENTLLKIALISSLVGIFLLYFLSRTIDVREYNPSIISNEENNNYVKIKGTVTKITGKDNLIFMEVSQQYPINVVVFDKKPELKEGDFIEVIGRIEEYKGKEEVVADRIRVIE